MGLLDDAIREHLELKRRHGADPADVSRLEQDAFGPVEAERTIEAAEPASEPPPEDRPPEPAHEAPEPRAAERVEQPTEQFSLEELEDAQRREAPPAPERERRPEPEPEPQPEPEPVDHDELEETPDFLQETPEHDKLWFEQKPPKDFDF